MASHLAWYAGQCVRRNDVTVAVKVIAIRSADEWTLVDNPQRLFPKVGEVEGRVKKATALRPNDWLSFQVALKGPRGRLGMNTYQHLLRYVDLQHLGDEAALRQALTVEGIEGVLQGGLCMIRTGEERLMLVYLQRGTDGRYLAAIDEPLQIFALDAACLHSIPTEEGPITFYEMKQVEPIEVLDWTPDAGYLKCLVRTIARSQDAETETVIAWVKRHADEMTQRIGMHDDDRIAARHAARTGELVKRLLADQAVAKDITDALLADDRMLDRLEAAILAVGEQERASIRDDLTRVLEQDIAAQREERLAALAQDLAAEEATERKALQARLETRSTARLAEMEAELVAQQAQKEAALAAELDTRRREEQRALDEIKAIRLQLQAEADALQAQVDAAQGTLEMLNSQHEAAAEALERLQQQAAHLELPKSVRLEACFIRAHQLDVPVLDMAGLRQAIEECRLLSHRGRHCMTQFVAMLLAGEMPVLQGPQTEDFLLVAEALLAAGCSMRLQADPTVITFEDLWVRAGTQLPTALTHGLEKASGKGAQTVLAVIEEADQSGARFWLPALADRTRRGDLPRRLLVCATVNDVESDEAQAIADKTPWLDISDVMDPAAAAMAPMLLGPDHVRQLDPGERPADLSQALAAVAPLAGRISMAQSMRLARTVTEWGRLSGQGQLSDAPAALSEGFFKRGNRLGAHPNS